ncbi:MAG: protein kinase [Gemmataceae bacterium]|nr:protein kinase [Gemmataceae bacterium]
MEVGETIGSGPNRFVITSELGSGAMGTVYKALFHHDGRVADVALKVVAPGLLGNDGARARFDREASILKQLRHPHIVRLFATGRFKRTPFIAMEFVDGEPLDRALARRNKLSWEEVAAYGRQLCEALQYAHEKGIIHRDLKPSNLMITPDGQLKLTDFGIAKDTDVTALTGANSTIGTAAYMSPEQCKGERNLTPKSDLYSLGVVFFELLSGRKPFAADTTVEMFMKHVHEAPPRIGKIVPGMPAKFEALVLQLLEKEKENRPTDAAWVGRMLGEVEEDAFARKSAGLDAATARRGDRPKRGSDERPLSDADKDAVRALRGVKKKKRKPDRVPVFDRPAVKAAALLAGLAGLAGLAYALTRPPSAEKLAAAVDAATTPAARLEAAEAYLRRYGDVPGEATDRAAAVFRDGQARDREGELAKRFPYPKLRADPDKADPDAYRDAMDAIQAEQAGLLADAAFLWERIEKRFPEEAGLAYTFDERRLENARLAWVAAKRRRDIRAVPAREKDIDARIYDLRRYEKAAPADPSNPDAVALKARRAEQAGDWEKAGRLWDAAVGLTDKDPDQHVLYLLAKEHRRAVDAKPPAADPAARRRDEVLKRVAAAEGRARELKNPGENVVVERGDWVLLRIALREVAELYEDEADPAVAEAVGRAKKLLAAVAKEGD